MSTTTPQNDTDLQRRIRGVLADLDIPGWGDDYEFPVLELSQSHGRFHKPKTDSQIPRTECHSLKLDKLASSLQVKPLSECVTRASPCQNCFDVVGPDRDHSEATVCDGCGEEYFAHRRPQHLAECAAIHGD